MPAVVRAQPIAKGELTDEQICRSKFRLADRESLQKRPMGEIMVAIGASFIGTRYASNILETPGDERLIVNLRELDCVTFVENTLALSRCITAGRHTFDQFKEELKFIRYRDGILNGYPSRLHYFSDWIENNETKNVVRNVSEEIGGVPYAKNLAFMSTHPASYKQLSNRRILDMIMNIESDISLRRRWYIPKEQLQGVEQKIESGDIIGITTSIEGLDISHTGMAIRTQGVLKYLHAPLSRGKVQISEQPLVEYLALHTEQTGIMVARPLAQTS